MFNFLYKKTDFYYESDPGDKMGNIIIFNAIVINFNLRIPTWSQRLNSTIITYYSIDYFIKLDSYTVLSRNIKESTTKNSLKRIPKNTI